MSLDITSKEYETMIDEMKQGKENVKTPWGNAKINNAGYYRITTGKDGFNMKYIHRLIWKAVSGKKIPDGYHIHHLDNNPLNNAFDNLECIDGSRHNSLHNKGENNHNYGNPRNYTPSEETRQKMSNSHTLPYVRIIKAGFRGGKQLYTLKFQGKQLKSSIHPDKLLKWFLENYPLEIIQVPSYCRKNK